MEQSRKTPLYQTHVDLKARLVDFHGWKMPIQYSSIMEEVKTVRENVGIFDISHMGQIEVKGKQAFELMQLITSNDLTHAAEGHCQYTVLMNDDGGIIDDLVVYMVGRERMFLCVNAANTETDVSWIADQALQYPDVGVKNVSRQYGLVALQGPNSEPLLQGLCRIPLSRFYYYNFATTNIGGINVILSRTGYTGEDGFEIYCDWRQTGALWKQIMGKGKSFRLKPVGLGARDILRLEMGYLLHGEDMGPDTTPFEAGLNWIVKLTKEDGFIGCDVLAEQYRNGVSKRMTAFEMIGRGIPRAGYGIFAGGRQVGEVTSGAMSPTLNKAIGLGYIETGFGEQGAQIQIDIRDKRIDAVVRKAPFVPSRVKKQPPRT